MRRRLPGFAAALTVVLAGPPAFSQDVSTRIVRDGSIGPDRSVQPVGMFVEIGEGLGERSADGLTVFHSFETFDVGQGGSVLFTTDVPARSVIARVTGGTRSSIFGEVDASLGVKNLYLLNPAGFLFGPGGRTLEISFSFSVFGTADRLIFANGASFEADEAEPLPPALAVDEVVEFDFRRPSGSIYVQGNSVDPLISGISGLENSLFFDGGVALIAGTPGTRIGFAFEDVNSAGEKTISALSLLAPGDVDATMSGIGLLQIDVGAFNSGGGIALLAGGSIEIRNAAVNAQKNPDEFSRDPSVQLLSPGSVRIADSSFGSPFVDFGLDSRSGEILIGAPPLGRGVERIFIEGGSVELLRSELLAEKFLAIESQGSIRVSQSRLLSNSGGAFVFRGGTNLLLDGSLIANQGMPANPFFPVGRFDLEAPLVEIVNGSRVSTASGMLGPNDLAVSGDISIRADYFRLSSSVLSSEVRPRPFVLVPLLVSLGFTPDQLEFSRAGSISIMADDIEILDRSSLISSALGDPSRLRPLVHDQFLDLLRGSAGQIVLEGSRSVRIADSDLDTMVDTQASRFPGSIGIRGGDVQIQNSSISAAAISGTAGNVAVQGAGTLMVRDSSITSSSLGEGIAGSVSISGNAIVLDGASVLSSNTGSGAAGSVVVDATNLTLTRGSQIATQAMEGPPAGQPADGSIAIKVKDSLMLSGASSINASVDEGQGGDVRIGSPEFVVLRDGSQVLAQTVEGNGGRVDITASAFIVDSTSRVSADASVGTNGTVDIRSPDVDLQGSLEGLPAAFLNVSALLRASCEAREVSGASAGLYVARASGLPVSPEEWLLAFDAPSTLRSGDRPLPEAAAAQDDTMAALDLARAQQASGAYGDSLATLTSALARAESTDDRAGIAGLLAAAGNAQQALGDGAAAEDLLTRGARIVRRGSPLASWIENDLGNLYAAQGAGERARVTYAKAIEKAEQANDTLAAAKALANAARLALESGHAAEANALLDRADERVRALPDQAAKAAVMTHLGRSRAVQAERAAETSVHAASLLRAHALLQSAAELAGKLSDARLRSYTLGNLGALYQSERRYGEALLLTREALREAERAQSPDPLYRWHRQEGQLLWAEGKAQPAVEAYRRAVAILEDTRQESRAQYGARADSFRRMVEPVYMDLADVLLRAADRIGDPARAESLLIEARATVELFKAAELRNYLRDDCSTQLEARTASLDSLASGAAVVYPIALRDRLELLVRLPSGLQRYTVPVRAEQIDAEARRFRRLVQDRTTFAYRPVAQQLYDWLVRPYAGKLGAAEVETLVFVPSGALRAVPMSALHDGKRFLAERFAVATAPGLSLVDPRPLDVSHVKPLLGGVSEAVQEFDALGSVPRELSAIQELFGGQVLLNQGFQGDAVRAAIRENRPTLVHFASHAVFTGDPNTSYLLTHDGRMTMGDLVDLLGPTRYRTDPIELLVLSACDTAVGDDRAALGLAGVAVRSGARSALGSLWAISDEATYPMVVSFYRSLREPGTSRAGALRTAQRQMLASEEFSHPFYWSTFVLISNWL